MCKQGLTPPTNSLLLPNISQFPEYWDFSLAQLEAENYWDYLLAQTYCNPTFRSYLIISFLKNYA